MTIAKTNTSLKAVASTLAAGTPNNATEWDMSALLSGLITGVLTNGGTAPTTAPFVVFYAGESTGVKREIWRMGGDIVANSITPIVFRVPKEVKFLNVTATGGGTTGGTWELMGLGFTGP